ncbi:MAG: HD domain-containing protein [Lachnospiraceae bacterium]|nr:HD domain-containing protein [Lachnospiraceae bacterium]
MSNYKSLSKEISEQIIHDREKNIKNPYAFDEEKIIRRYKGHDTPRLWRPAFVMDVEKIMHNNYYNRYSDKTQVLSCFKNDDISRRALHVQYVSRIARTIGMTLGLNLDLIEAISIGHDIGHTPFGHTGEKYLNDLYYGNTSRLFNHNVHSVRVLDKLIKRNISLQTLDGVICHNGEMEQQEYRPIKLDSFDHFDQRVESCYVDPSANKKQIPSTLEACVMRVSDIIAYLGKDRQDAIKIGLLDSHNAFSAESLGNTNAEIINNMTVSIIENSYGKPYLSMDKDVYDAFSKAKKENYELIYNDDKREDLYEHNIKPMFEQLYNELLSQAKTLDTNSILYKHHIDFIRQANQYSHYQPIDEFMDEYTSSSPDDIVMDFMASMTDDYFIDLYKYLFPNGKYKAEYTGYFD